MESKWAKGRIVGRRGKVFKGKDEQKKSGTFAFKEGAPAEFQKKR
jgi:hypothetical protein